MATKRKPSEEYTAFQSTLRRVLQTSHEELKQRLEAEKEAKKKKRTSKASGPASSGSD